jgi:hypothetical protein
MYELKPEQKNLLAAVREDQSALNYLYREAKGMEWLKPFLENGLFKPETIPGPISTELEGHVRIPIWPPVFYLHNIRSHLLNHENHDYAALVWGIIKDCTQYARVRNLSNFQVWLQFAEIVPYIPSDLMQVDECGLIVDHWLIDPFGGDLILHSISQEWLPKLLESSTTRDHQLAERLLAAMTRISHTTSEDERSLHKAWFQSDKRGYWIGELFKKQAKKIGETIGEPAWMLMSERIREVMKCEGNDEWSFIWQPAIEDHPQNEHHDECRNILVYACREVLLAIIEKNSEMASRHIGACLNDELQIIRRIGIHALNTKFNLASNIVDSVLGRDLLNTTYRHEMWHLLRNRFHEFTQTQMEAVIRQIESLDDDKEDDEKRVRYLAYKKACWYAAIKDHPLIVDAYRKCLDIIEHDPDHPDFDFYSSGARFYEPMSPFTVPHLLSYDPEMLVKEVLSYKGPKSSIDEPDLEGLLRAFRDTFKAAPEKYINDLAVFATLPPYLIFEIFAAYATMWKENREDIRWEIAWEKILGFCTVVISNEAFWDYEESVDGGEWFERRNFVPGAIAELIEAGTRDDSNAFDPKHLPQALMIITTMLEHLDSRDFQETTMGALTAAINSQKGKCIESLINLSLRGCRVADKAGIGHGHTWTTHYEPVFARLVDSINAGGYEFAVLYARYLVNFLYMSKPWTICTMPIIFNLDHPLAWKCAMEGYAYINIIYPEIYNFLRDGGHFERALDDQVIGDVVKKSIIANALVSYFAGDEILGNESAMIERLFVRQKPGELRDLAWQVWPRRSDKEKEDCDILPKVKDLWRRMPFKLMSSTKEWQEVASTLCTWCVFVDKPEEWEDLLLPIVSYADVSHNSYTLIEEMAKWVDAYPLTVHRLYMQLLDGHVPAYPKEAVRKIVEGIYRCPGGARLAHEIATKCMTSGYYTPGEIIAELEKANSVHKTVE